MMAVWETSRDTYLSLLLPNGFEVVLDRVPVDFRHRSLQIVDVKSICAQQNGLGLAFNTS